MVQKGAPLVEIDPRPFQVQLEQAEGQLLKDQAALRERADRPAAIRIADHQERRRPASLQTQRATVAQTEATVKTDQANIDSAKLNIDLLPHYRADHRPHRSSTCRSRQLRVGRREHAAARSSPRPSRSASSSRFRSSSSPTVRAPLKAGNRLRVDAIDRNGQTDSRQRRADDARQPDRSDHRHAETPRDGCQQGRRAVSEPVRERAHAGAGKERRHADPECRRPAQRANDVCLRRRSPTSRSRFGMSRLAPTDDERSEVVWGIPPHELVVTQGVDRLQAGSRVAVSWPQDEDTRKRDRNAAPVATSGRSGNGGGAKP